MLLVYELQAGFVPVSISISMCVCVCVCVCVRVCERGCLCLRECERAWLYILMYVSIGILRYLGTSACT